MSVKEKIRLQIAQEAARIMVEEGVHNHWAARRKAALRVGAESTRNLPRVEDIDAALIDYHSLYRPAAQALHIARLRKLAAEAMQFLEAFSPLLVGGVWDGSAGKFTPVTLHLFPDAPEDVIRKLLDARIPFEEKSHMVPLGVDRSGGYPMLVFYVDGTPMELLLFPPDLKGRSLKRKGGRLPGCSLKELADLIGSTQKAPHVET
ncbi:MAG TPA: hypothetical protein VLU73_04745 [Methylococcaceae bacterium]|jgi:hypothetical protein|nr:hypothetical protein [Methylococcaceae bacterium]